MVVCGFMCTCAHDCLSVTLFSFVCSCVDKDLETGPSIPGSQSPSIVTVNDLHMVPASAAYSNIPVYSNVRGGLFLINTPPDCDPGLIMTCTVSDHSLQFQLSQFEPNATLNLMTCCVYSSQIT